MNPDSKDRVISGFLEMLLGNPVLKCKVLHFAENGSDDGKISIWKPELMPEALPGIVGEFVHLATEDSEADPVAVLASFLTYFGVEIGNGPHVMVGEDVHPARLFVAIVGKSSKARKGTSMGPVLSVYRDFNSYYSSVSMGTNQYSKAAETTPGPLSSGEGIVHRLGNEKSSSLGAPDKRLFVHDSEFVSALKLMTRQGNILSSIIRQLWDSGNVDIITKHDPSLCKDAHVGIVTHITVHELRKYLSDTELFSGFANRYIWVLVDRPKLVPIPKPMDNTKLESVQNNLYKIVTKAQQRGRMKFSNDAMELWKEIYPLLTYEVEDLPGEALHRSEAQMIRLSLIYALLDEADRIEAKHILSALAFWQYAHYSALLIFDDATIDKKTKKIITALKVGACSKSELYNVFQNNISKEELDSKLGKLIEYEIVEEVRDTISKRGPKTMSYKLSKITKITKITK